ncbi:putative membrane protein [Virgibacillus natechei]|uniref:Membrane protein n=1 Tax=Virgibacillus natechei TaxID=1216297 RepID=A0ABS4IH36_9BACI|nr:small multi-drug export protein [Virgibacillus natechei]MBP1970273.1 putative membrane protein [Virgibacillus natechei]UZD12783.1 small multi-drug export protein [Virgibacillus natechei]
MFYEYALVFLGAAIPWFEIALVIPLGIIGGLSPFWVILLAFIGNLITVIPIAVGFDKLKAWYAKRAKKKGKTPSQRSVRGKKIWEKYGLPGLALLGPILIGTHIATFVGMSLGTQKMKVMVWMTISIGVWSLIFGIATDLGLDLFL